ncbi:hypothetical protein ACWN8B_01730 [Vagococcus zengguangii]|uniref:Uncharacterized protein n=1 Tax=Vagococcus zengguangii TaxID=2571750 RepID=A0A4D7CTY5_9ENTE|nr:hypothetical protein [Vagococcus zengguangii]QCI85857.1 hypothetical protein FA707_02245 [Vagococcus zengguangii]
MVDDKKMIQEKVINRFQQLFNDKDYAKAIAYLESRKEYLGDKFEEMIQWFITNRMLKISQASDLEDNSLFKDVLGLITTNDFKKANALVDTNKNLLGNQYFDMKNLLAFARNQALKLALPEEDHGIVADINKLVSTNRFAEANILVDGYKDKLGNFYEDIKDWLAFGKANPDYNTYDIKSTFDKVTDAVTDKVSDAVDTTENTLDKVVDVVSDKFTTNTPNFKFDFDGISNLFTKIAKPDLTDKLAGLLMDKNYNQANLLVDRNKKDFGDYVNDVRALINTAKTPGFNINWTKLVPGLGVATAAGKMANKLTGSTPDIKFDFDGVKNLFAKIGKPNLTDKLAGFLMDKNYNQANLLVDRNEKDFGDYVKDVKGLINFAKGTPDFNLDWTKLVSGLGVATAAGKMANKLTGSTPDIKFDFDGVKNLFTKIGKPDLTNKLGGFLMDKKYNEANLLVDRNEKDFGDYANDVRALISKAKLTPNFDLDWTKLIPSLGAAAALPKVGLVDGKDTKVKVEATPEIASLKTEEKPKKSLLGSWLPWVLGLGALGLLGGLLGLFNPKDDEVALNTATSSSETAVVEESSSEKVVVEDSSEADKANSLLDPAKITSVFPAIDLGSKVKIQDFATKFADGTDLGDIDLTKEYTVDKVEEKADGDAKRSYFLPELNKWISEKDLFPELPTVDVDPISIASKFPALAKGAKVKLQDFADKFTDGLAIPDADFGKEFTIAGIKEVADGDSTRAYYLEEARQWISEHNLFSKEAVNDKLKEATFAIGQTVKVAEHATHYEERNEIPADVKGKEYIVEDIHVIDIDDSNIAYKLQGLDYWVIQQDIIK